MDREITRQKREVVRWKSRAATYKKKSERLQMTERELRLLSGCSCMGFHSHSHGVCNTCKKPVIDWIDAHEAAVWDSRREQWRVELIKAADDAILAQERIIANDGALEAHVVSLRKLKNQKAMLFSDNWIDSIDTTPIAE